MLLQESQPLPQPWEQARQARAGEEAGTTLQGRPPQYLLGPSHRVGMALHQFLEGDGLHVQNTGDLQKDTCYGQGRGSRDSVHVPMPR